MPIPLYPIHRTPFIGGTAPGVVTVDAAGLQNLLSLPADPAKVLSGGLTWVDQVGAQGPVGPAGADGNDGAPGAAGADGREVALRNTGSAIEWQYLGGSWTQLVTLAAITGPQGIPGSDGADGTDGEDGTQIQLRREGTAIEWQYLGEADWYLLLYLTDITGPAGSQGIQGPPGAAGADGDDGADGREVALRNSGTAIEWRYVGGSWTQLVTLAAITGPAGTDGIDGTDGEDGADADLSLDASLPDHAVDGLTVTRRADAATSLFEAGYIKSDGDIAKAKADAAGTVPGLLLATAAINSETNGVWLLHGLARDDSWSWTPGGPIYISPATAGALTQTRPSTAGHQVQIAGYALSATVIFWCPNSTIVEVV